MRKHTYRAWFAEFYDPDQLFLKGASRVALGLMFVTILVEAAIEAISWLSTTFGAGRVVLCGIWVAWVWWAITPLPKVRK